MSDYILHTVNMNFDDTNADSEGITQTHTLHVNNDWMNDGVVLSLWETHHHHQHISIKKKNFFILLYFFFLLTSSFPFFYQEYLMKFSAKVERDVKGSEREKRKWTKEKWKCAFAICAQNKSIVTPYCFMKFRFLLPPSHPHFLDIELGHFLHILHSDRYTSFLARNLNMKEVCDCWACFGWYF